MQSHETSYSKENKITMIKHLIEDLENNSKGNNILNQLVIKIKKHQLGADAFTLRQKTINDEMQDFRLLIHLTSLFLLF